MEQEYLLWNKNIYCGTRIFIVDQDFFLTSISPTFQVYMTYVQALYGGGGWPLSVFLSPDLKPLMGGTYFPPEDKYGRPGFKTILR